MATNFKISKGNPKHLGAHIEKNGVNFAVFSANATHIEICLFDDNDVEIAKIPLTFKTGNVFHSLIHGIFEGAKYNIRAFGSFAPENGDWFLPQKALFDPFAIAIDRPFSLDDAMFMNDLDSGKIMPKAVIQKPNLAKPKSNIPIEEYIIYELHVKGFTQNFPSIDDSVRGRFKGLGTQQAINYLKELGINAVEILPSMAWVDELHLKKLELRNYWGYNPIGFLCPDPKLAPEGWNEVRECVQSLEENGIETIIDVVFNHSGEGDKNGPILSMRGLDNKNYYRINENGEYSNEAGCGNVLNCQEPFVMRLILDALRAWRQYGGVHGFRFDLGTILGRDANGFDKNAPLLNAIAHDPILRDVKIIVEPWDCAEYHIGEFNEDWCEWNDKYRDDLRRFWRGDAISLSKFATRLCGSDDIFASKSPAKSINFLTAHDGFTLKDLVSYNSKHNLNNGENNRDGSDNNLSQNHGVEGETQDDAIIKARNKTMRNMLACLLLSRGTPMISMGSEISATQFGNNNAYAQDNFISHIDWNSGDFQLRDFVAKLIKTRKRHRAIFSDKFLKSAPNPILNDVEWRTKDGFFPSDFDWQNSDCKSVFAALNDDEDYVFLAINRADVPIEVNLPTPLPMNIWEIEIDTDGATIIADNSLILPANSVVLLQNKTDDNAKKHDCDETILNKVCDALGINQSWWDVTGNETIVPKASKKAIISAMGYDCENSFTALKSLQSIEDEYLLRPIPHFMSFDQGDEIIIPFRASIGMPPILQDFNLIAENGETNVIKPIFFAEETLNLSSGRKAQIKKLKLKNLNIGYYELCLGTHKCKILISPKKAYAPKSFDERCFGFSVQLYSTKRDDNQGFGDFTNLSEILKFCKNSGGDIVAINPLHALFQTNRNLKSPYYPSDRRFIEPLYIDIEKVADIGELTPQVWGEFIDYEGAWKQKDKALRNSFIYQRNNANFVEYCANAPKSLEDYAIFEAIEKIHNRNWPKELWQKCPQAIAEFVSKNSDEIDYQKYLQYLCELQLSTANQTKLEIGLNRDLAVGSASNGAEYWSNYALFATNVSIGAPPDPLGPQGQVWGLPPYSPLKLFGDQFSAITEIFARNMENAGALRIDHAMGLMRQFWVPNGMNGSHGAYVNFPFKEIMAILKYLSHKYECLIIGEDLGTVPHGFSENMRQNNILSYKVLPFEQDNFGFKPPQSYPCESFACVSTHDLPPILGWLKGGDIDARAQCGVFNDHEKNSAHLLRKEDVIKLKEAIIANNIAVECDLENENNLVIAIHKCLATSSAHLTITQIEDIGGECMPINLPGTDKEFPNWQKRMTRNLSEIFAQNDENSKEAAIISALARKNRQNAA